MPPELCVMVTSPFQSTRPRGARQILAYCAERRILVSIHAPARGATLLRFGFVFKGESFNPRAREGRDRGSYAALKIDADVSIHAPARGATRLILPSVVTGLKFQSTRPRGARPVNISHAASFSVFQSTRPRGARLISGRALTARRHCFNPRAREGRDYRLSSQLEPKTVSIHAPARGATFLNHKENIMAGFQSTRPRGARPFMRAKLPHGQVFQSTRPRGARHRGIRHARLLHSGVSIHAPARGAT